jgi:MFS family permease
MQKRDGIYYGWIMLFTLAITETVSWGILYYAFAVFFLPMQNELGWSRSEISGVISIALVVSGLLAIPVGRWVDRHGTRLIMTLGSILASLLLVAWANLNNLFQFYLIGVGLGVAMATVLYEPAFVVVTTWFNRKRGKALTILTFIGGFASVIFIPLSEWLVQSFGWRNALVILAVILAVITIPLHALILRRKPEDLGLRPDGNLNDSSEIQSFAPVEDGTTTREALGAAAFWWLVTAFGLNTLIAVAIKVHFMPYLIGQGYASGFAALSIGLIGITGLPGRLIFTPLGEKFSRKLMVILIFFLQTLALLFLLLIPNIAGVFLFIALFGVGFGAITPLKAGMLAEFYGRKHYGSISGVMALFITVARGIAPLIAGIGYDLFNNYAPVMWIMVVISLLSTLTIPFAQRKRVVSKVNPARQGLVNSPPIQPSKTV